MTAVVEIDFIGKDELSNILGDVVDAFKDFVFSASESEQAISSLDSVLRSTAAGAGTFTETIGLMNSTQLSDLYTKLENAKNKLAEMKDEFGNARTYTDAESTAIAAQRDLIANLTNEIQRGTNGLQVFHDTTQLSRDALLQLAAALQKTTQYSDEQVTAAEAMMLRFENVNHNIFPQAIQLSTDLAQSLGIDLTSAARMVGMALDNPEQGIGRLNTAFRIFSDTEMETIKNMAANGDIASAQAMIMERLTEKVGGAAQAFGLTFAGMVDIAKNKLDDLKETIGNAVLPALETLLTKFNAFLDSPAVQNFVKDVADNIRDLASALLSDDPVGAVDTWIGKIFQRLADDVNNWVHGGGADQLSQDLISWINHLGEVTNFNEELYNRLLSQGRTQVEARAAATTTSNPALEGIQNLVNAIANAIEQVDWTGVEHALSNKISAEIDSVPWNDLGRQFGESLVNSITGFFDGGSTGSSGTGGGTTGGHSGGGTQSVPGSIAHALENFLAGALGMTDWQTFKDNFWDMLKVSLADLFLIHVLGVDGLQISLHAIQIVNDLNDIGVQIINGIIRGVESTVENLYASMRLSMELMVMQVKVFLGIFSPSTVFYNIGVDIIQGLINGIGSIVGNVVQTFKDLIYDITHLPGWDDVLNFLGITPSSGGTTGSHSTGGVTTPGGGTGGVSGGTVTNIYNIYGPSYWSGTGPDGECIPSPVMTGGVMSPSSGTMGTLGHL